MQSTPRRISVLELRSVRGTGGGPEKTILLGADRRARDRFDVTVCYLRDLRDAVFGIDQRAGAIEIDYVEIRERHSFDVRIWRALKALVHERAIDIVHSHEYKTDFLAWLLGRRTGVIPLATAHGWTGHSPRERRLYYPLDKRLLGWFPRVIAVSTDIKDELVRHGARPERVLVILNAIDPELFRRRGLGAEVRAEIGLPRDSTVVGAVGRLEPQKRFDLLLEAASPVLERRQDVHLVIAGDGSLRADLESRVRRLAAATRIHMIGHYSDVARLHEAFDGFVQSSDYEGTPNAVLEAMAMATPLVATGAGGTAELVTHNVHGLIVPPADVDALRGAMSRMLDDVTGARARAALARARVETELSFDVRTRRLEAVYAELVGLRARGTGRVGPPGTGHREGATRA